MEGIGSSQYRTPLPYRRMKTPASGGYRRYTSSYRGRAPPRMNVVRRRYVQNVPRFYRKHKKGGRKLQLFDEQLKDVSFINTGKYRLLNRIELGNKKSDRQSDKIVVKGIKLIGNVQLGASAKEVTEVHHVLFFIISDSTPADVVSEPDKIFVGVGEGNPETWIVDPDQSDRFRILKKMKFRLVGAKDDQNPRHGIEVVDRFCFVDVWTDFKDALLGNVANIQKGAIYLVADEAHNTIIRTSGQKRVEPKLKNHVELLGIADTKRGANVAGGRGFYLKGAGVRLNQALINFGLDFLEERGYTSLQTPFFMRKDIMAKCAQLAQFDEELYKVTGEGEDKYLIATAEQPLCAYHLDDWIHPSQLPLRYAGYSSCFRKEAGAHGRDTLGIFRVHQFEKVEQFCLTSPNGNESWDMHEEMIKNSEEFYKALNIPYQVVSIVSGALNDAAAKKYDLEGWYPASNTYRELVSCSNCTDYQSRRLEIRFGQKKAKQYVHLLNSTLTATERTICCILENYQRDDGVEIPEVLQKYMGGKTFLPFPTTPEKEAKGKKSKA